MAKVSREQARLNRDRVVQVASRLFRERGTQGIGIADLMAEAGLTHGGFYNSFPSKDALIAEACHLAFQDNAFSSTLGEGRILPRDLSTLAAVYLSAEHLSQSGSGCPLPALAADAAREPAGSPLRQTFTKGLSTMTDRIMAVLPGASRTRKRERALTAMATLVGALTLARAVDDDELAEEILEAARASLRSPKS